jgi:hypothetical protein
MRGQQCVDAPVLRRVIGEPQAKQDVGVDADHRPADLRPARLGACSSRRCFAMASIICRWRTLRGLKQPPDAPTVGLDLPGGDRVVCLDLEVEDRSSIQAQTAAHLLGQGELSFAGQRGERDCVPSGSKYSLHSTQVRSIERALISE